MNKKYTVAVDFDGVLHSYTSPWAGASVIPDPPVAGAIEWLSRLIQDFEVVVFSTRAKWWFGRRAMRRWLKTQAGNLWYESMGYRGLEDVAFSATKGAALVYVDDRAWRFDGQHFPSAQEIHAARPWNKPVAGASVPSAGETPT